LVGYNKEQKAAEEKAERKVQEDGYPEMGGINWPNSAE
jgi:hypothetical protein